MSGGLRKRQDYFVQVPSDTIRDRRLSYRARGLLAYLLDMPDGWDVKSEHLASQTDGEGREAVRTALHELGKCGYYRLERRRMRTGQFVMGTAITAKPDAEWAADYEATGGKAVLVIEQEDGTFRVQRPDGSTHEDGFTRANPDEPGQDQPRPIDTGDGFPGAGDPVTGIPGSGQRDALSSTHTQNQDVVRDGSATPHHPAQAAVVEALADQPDLPLDGIDQARDTKPVNVSQAPEAPEAAKPVSDPMALARDIATRFTDWYETKNGPIVKTGKSSPYMALVTRLIGPALEAGYTSEQVRTALARGGEQGEYLPAVGRFQQRLAEVKTGRTMGGRPRPANIHQDDPDTEAQRAYRAQVAQAWGETA